MKIYRNTLINVLGLVIPSLVAFPTMGCMGRVLGVEKFGLYMLAFSLVGYAGIFDMGLSRAVIRSIAMNDSDPDKCRTIIGTASRTVLALSLIATGLVFFLSKDIVHLLKVSDDSTADAIKAFQILAFVIPPFLLGLVWFSYPEGRQNFIKLNVCKSISGIMISIIPMLLIICNPCLSNAVLGLLVARYLALIPAYIPCKQELGNGFFKYEWSVLKELFSFGGWVTVSNIISPIMVYSDRFVLSSFIGADKVAFYTAPSEAVARMSIIPGALSRTIFPYLSKLQSEGISEAKKANVTLLCTVIIMSLPIFIMAKPILDLWLGNIYGEESTNILRVLIIGFIFNSIAQIPFSHIQACGKSRLTATIHLIEVIPYLLVFIGLVYCKGLLGAAIAWTLRVTIDCMVLLIQMS